MRPSSAAASRFRLLPVYSILRRKQEIRKDGIVREGNVLKVDSFINHQMDIPLFREMAKEWKRLFDGKPINKVLTIEASGIGIAAVVASEFNVPVVFAKKSMSINLDYDPAGEPRHRRIHGQRHR